MKNLKSDNKKWHLIKDAIIKPRVPKKSRHILAKKDAEKYFEIHKSKSHPVIKRYRKSIHFMKWAIKLIVPDFLIGHPNLWDNLKILRKHPQFKPLRMALVAWLIFTLTIGSTGIYSLITAHHILAATYNDNTQSEFDAGTYDYTQWDGTNSWVEGTNTTPNPLWELPDSAVSTDWVDMTGNVGLWHMNEASGTIEDTSGQGNNGTENGGVTYSVDGKLNTALDFDGVDDYISIPDSDSFDVTNFTLSAWIYRDSSGSQSIIERGTWGETDYYGMTFSGDTLFLQANGKFFSAGILPLNTWIHVVGILEGTTGKVYVNGVLVSTGVLGVPVAGSHALTVGSRLAGRLFDGKIDEVAVYNRALSATEIANIYENQAPIYKGTYTSDIKDVGNSTYNSIAWTPERPVGKELPDDAATETAYSTGNADMTGNVLLMHMNESIGTIEDTSGEGNDGTENGGVTYSVGGKLNTALSFDGVDDYISIPDDNSLNITGAITTEAWINMDSIKTYGGIVTKMGGTYPYLFEFYATSGKLSLYMSGANTQWVDSFNTVVPLYEWTYVVATFDEATNELKYYFNGVLDASYTKTGTMQVNTADVNIGRRSDGYSFDGSIDEVAIYNRALSATEIADHYERGALRLKAQVRSCDDSTCSGESFIGPDGTDSDYYEWKTSNSTSTPSFNLTNVSDNQYFQYKTFFETDDASYTPELKSVTVDYTLLNIMPDTPTNTTPANSATKQSKNTTLVASAFSDSDVGDTHQDSQWQVDNDPDFSSPVWTSLSGTNATTTDVNTTNGYFTNELAGKATLDANTTYYWRVRYQDDKNGWSDYSVATSYTTEGDFVITAPTAGNIWTGCFYNCYCLDLCWRCGLYSNNSDG